MRCDSSLFDIIGEYSLPEKELEVFTRLKWEQLNSLNDMLISLRNSQSRSAIRDVKEKLKEQNFKVLMTALKGKRKQLSADESNESRFVTNIRWAVEWRT